MDQNISIQLPAWYQSTTGPQISKTIFNLVCTALPFINLLLANQNIQIMPAPTNAAISMIVFVYFVVQVGVGYIRSKKLLGMQLGYAQRQLESMKK